MKEIVGFAHRLFGDDMELIEFKKPDSEQTILYIVANADLGWRKIGIGFGGRLDKWRREGWVIEQLQTFDDRESALFAETQVKKALFTDVVTLKDRVLPADGHTEIWPIEWGTFDLKELKELVDSFQEKLTLLFMDNLRSHQVRELIEKLGEEFIHQADTAENTESLDRLRDQLEELRSAINARRQKLSRPEN